MAKLKEAHKTEDVAGIDTSLAELNNAWTAASEEMYKTTQDTGAAGQEGQPDGQQPQGEGATAGGGDDNVTDAEFEEVK